jgi:branched-chain amino acid transport system ATP-binding protein
MPSFPLGTQFPLGLAAFDAAALSPEIALQVQSLARTRDDGEAPLVPAGLLRFESVSLSFGGVAALEEIDLVVRDGEIRAIIGPNGAGKSSMVNLISGVYRPDRGRIHLDGTAYGRVPTQRLAALGVARTFQNLALFKGLSVLENVVAGRARHFRSTFAEQILGLGRSRREAEDARSRALGILDFLHLSNVSDRLVGTLPYGVQKRVELAQALVAEPKLLLLDEPMAGMTGPEKQEMRASSGPRATGSAPPSC